MSVERAPRDVARIAELKAEVAALHRKVTELTNLVEELLKRQRKHKRQAAPFARDKGKDEADKKRPGRRNGWAKDGGTSVHLFRVEPSPRETHLS